MNMENPKPYVPSEEEMKKAKDAMTLNQMNSSKAREALMAHEITDQKVLDEIAKLEKGINEGMKPRISHIKGELNGQRIELYQEMIHGDYPHFEYWGRINGSRMNNNDAEAYYRRYLEIKESIDAEKKADNLAKADLEAMAESEKNKAYVDINIENALAKLP